MNKVNDSFEVDIRLFRQLALNVCLQEGDEWSFCRHLSKPNEMYGGEIDDTRTLSHHYVRSDMELPSLVSSFSEPR